MREYRLAGRFLQGKKIAVTGASGFLGSVLLHRLRVQKAFSRALVKAPAALPATETLIVGPLQSAEKLRRPLSGMDTVVHLAGHAHVMVKTRSDPLTAYRSTNVEGTRRLAEAAAEAGVRRFIFISSIKVNGERTEGQPFSAFDVPNPEDAYGMSKAEAEQVLTDIGARTGVEVCIIRPPLVYGPGVKGNFARLMKLIERGIPLPFGAVENQRSLVSLDNLCDLIIQCIAHPKAADQTFLISDGEDLSTPELLTRMGEAMRRPARLIPFPLPVLRVAFSLIGRGAEYERLTGSLQVDIEHTRRTLDWSPPLSVAEGLRRVVPR
jgi:nucleoside-diphosphate-sugar epimerase